MSGDGSSPFHSPNTPAFVPGYELLRRIGDGRNSEVWLARHSTLGALHAVKIVWQGPVTERSVFEKEIEGVRRFEPVSREHEGLVDLLQVGRTENGQGFYYAMELADCAPADDAGKSAESMANERMTGSADAGREDAAYTPRTLASELQRRGRLSAQESLDVATCLARTLVFLQSRKPALVHRDIKPENVVYVSGQPKLADPGLVTLSGDHVTWCGTTGYIPPEGPKSPAADVYALGKTLYTVSTGLPPTRFPEWPEDQASRPDHPLWLRLNQVLCRACENDPRARYTSAAEMLADLVRVRSGRPPKLGKRKWGGGAGLAFVGSVVLAWASGLLSEGVGKREGDGGGLARLDSAWRAARPRELIFEDVFTGYRLNVDAWFWNFEVRRAEPSLGKSSPQVSVDNGSLLIANWVQHERGMNIQQDVWLGSRLDLKSLGDTLVEIDLSGSVKQGGIRIDVIEDRAVDKIGRLKRVTLFLLSAGKVQTNELNRLSLAVELSPRTGLGVARWHEGNRARFRLFDLAPLKSWRLFFATSAHSAAQMGAGLTQLKLHRVRISRAAPADQIIGWVSNEVAVLPVAGIEVVNRTTGQRARANALGEYALPAKLGENEPAVPGEAYELVRGPERVRLAESGWVRRDLAVRKRRLQRGDVAEAVFISDIPLVRLAINDTLLYSLDTDGEVVRFDRHARILDRLGSIPAVAGLCWANGSLFAIGTFKHAWLYEFDPSAEPVLRPLFSVGNRTLWPTGLAFDGTNFWFAESDREHTNRFGVYAVRASDGTGQEHLPSSDGGLEDVAWGERHLWVSSSSGWLYEVDVAKARQGNTLEAGIVARYPGVFGGIEFWNGQLWSFQGGWLRRTYLTGGSPAAKPGG